MSSLSSKFTPKSLALSYTYDSSLTTTPAAGKFSSNNTNNPSAFYFNFIDKNGVDQSLFFKSIRGGAVLRTIVENSSGDSANDFFVSSVSWSGSVVAVSGNGNFMSQTYVNATVYDSYYSPQKLQAESSPTLGDHLNTRLKTIYDFSGATTFGTKSYFRHTWNTGDADHNGRTYILAASNSDGSAINMYDYAGNAPTLTDGQSAAVSGVITGYALGIVGAFATGSYSGLNTNDGETISIFSSDGTQRDFTVASNGAGAAATFATETWDTDATTGNFTINGQNVAFDGDATAVQAALDAAMLNVTANAGSPSFAVQWNASGPQTLLTLTNGTLQKPSSITGESFGDGDGMTPAAQTWAITPANGGTYNIGGSTVNWNDDNATLSTVFSIVAAEAVTVTGDQSAYTATWTDPSSGKSAITLTNVDLLQAASVTNDVFTDGTSAIPSNNAEMITQINGTSYGFTASSTSADSFDITATVKDDAYNAYTNLASGTITPGGWTGGITHIDFKYANFKIEGGLFTDSITGSSSAGSFTVTRMASTGGGTGLTCTATQSGGQILIEVSNGDSRPMEWMCKLEMAIR